MALTDHHDGILFDLDGVLYAGPHAVHGAPEALTQLKSAGVQCAFVTNNASRSADSVAEHLNGLGIPAVADEVYGSAPAGVALMAEHIPAGSAVLVTGSEYLAQLVHVAGYTVVTSADQQPAAVIQGFAPELGWKDLAEAAYAINNGAVWLATNLDGSVPRDRGVAPGNGALVEAVHLATGQRPFAAGKPEPVMFRQAAETLGLQNPLIIGDRLDTDILGGNWAGFTTALVLTGVDSAESARAASPDMRPNYVLDTLDDLFDDATGGDW